MLNMLIGESFMVGVMARCSVVMSLGNKESVMKRVYEMEYWMRMMSPPPPDEPG